MKHKTVKQIPITITVTLNIDEAIDLQRHNAFSEEGLRLLLGTPAYTGRCKIVRAIIKAMTELV